MKRLIATYVILSIANFNSFSQYHVNCDNGSGKIYQLCREYYTNNNKKAEWISLSKKNIIDTLNNKTLDTLFKSHAYFIDIYAENYVDKSDSVILTFFNYTRAWYENGNIEETACFIDSNGTKKKYFYENGQIEKEGYFRDNKKNGEWLYYDKNGVLLRKEKWIDGTKIL